MPSKTSHVLTEDMRKLVEDNMSLIPYAMNKYLRCIHMDIEDKYSVACYGLCRAAESFNPKYGYTFSTYAIRCIISHVKRQSKYELNPSRHNTVAPISLNTTCNDDKDLEYLYSIEDPSVNVEGEVLNKLLLEKVKNRCPILTELAENDVTEMSLVEKMGLSKQRISQKKKAEIELAKKMLAQIGIESA